MNVQNLRPPLLSIGVVLAAVKAILSAVAAVIGLLVSMGGLAISIPILVAEQEAESILPVAAVGTVFGLLLALLLAMDIVKLFACWGSWNMRRTWLILLLVLTVAGLVLQLLTGGGGKLCCCCFPIAALIDLVLFAGIIQALPIAPSRS